MNRTVFLLIVSLIFILTSSFLWNTQSEELENDDMYSIATIIAGNFPKHSQAYNLWIIKDRNEKIKTESWKMDLYNDLATAYVNEKRYEDAIAAMTSINTLRSDVYEINSNLATIHLLFNEPAEGLYHSMKAMSNVPKGRFTNENYKLLLAEYINTKLDSIITLPLDPTVYSNKKQSDKADNFYHHLLRDKYGDVTDSLTLSEEEKAQAVIAILAMMRFSDTVHPILLEALGDLLSEMYERIGFTELAARAYLKASYEAGDKKVSTVYRKKAAGILVRHKSRASLSEVEKQLKKEISNAESFHAEIKANEERWLKEMVNAEESYKKKYGSRKNDPNWRSRNRLFHHNLLQTGDISNPLLTDYRIISLQETEGLEPAGDIQNMEQKWSAQEATRLASYVYKKDDDSSWATIISVLLTVVGILLHIIKFLKD